MSTTPPLNTLYATIEREWLARIIDGSKKIEYRDASEYWLKRLEKVGPPPFRLRLVNGMSKNAPEATVMVERVDIEVLAAQIRLHIREVLETLRWNPAWHTLYPPLPPEDPLDASVLAGEEVTETDIFLPVPRETLESLVPGELTTFSLPLDMETYSRFAEAPDGFFTLWLEADRQTRQVVLLSAIERYFEEEVDYGVIAWPIS